MPVDPDSAENISDGLFTVTTDLTDYAPGSTAIFTAWNVGVGGTAEFQVQHLDAGADGVLGTADDVLDAGADGVYGTADDGYGPAPGDYASDHDSFFAIDGVGIEGLDGVLGSDDDLLLDASSGLYSRDGLYADLDGEANGQISVGWYVREPDSLNELFRLTGTSSDGASDTATFTDGQLSLYAWRNQPGPTLNKWDAGTTIQQANSIYAEDEVIPFRWTSTAGGGSAPNMIEGVTYTIRIDYAHRGGTSDPGKFFFDYLASYNATEGASNPFGPGSDLAGFQSGLLSSVAILADTDPDILGEIAGFFTLFNIDPTSISYIGYSEDPVNTNQEDRRLTFTFTPNDGDAIAGESVNVGIA